MRTHSLFFSLLMFATVAWGGQHDQPEVQWTHRDHFHTPGMARLAHSLPPFGVHANDVHIRALKTLSELPDPLHNVPAFVKPLISRAVPGELPIDPVGAPTGPIFDRHRLADGPERTIAIMANTTRTARFDTVYDPLPHVERKHVFTYDRGLLIQRLTMVRINAVWYEEEGYTCAYTPSGLLARRTRFGDQRSRPMHDESWDYDPAGRVISRRETDYGFPPAEVPRYAYFDSARYDAHGEQIYQRREEWHGMTQTGGYETCVTYEDTSTVASYAEWQRGEWVDTWRSIHSGSPGDGQEITRYQTWNGVAWVTDHLSVQTYDAALRPIRYSGCQWLDGTWVETYREFNRYSATGRVVEQEYLIDSVWRPLFQFHYTMDEMGRTLIDECLWWDDGWNLEYKSCFAYGTDGSVVRSDSGWQYDGWLQLTATTRTDASGGVLDSGSYWGHGTVIQSYAYAVDASGHVLLNMARSWDSSRAVWTGGRHAASYSPDGQPLEAVQTYEGLPYEDTRYLFSYDEAHRVRSVKVYLRSGDTWIDSCAAGWANSGSHWGFGQNDPTMSFFRFDELIFAYRTGVSDAGAITGERPERTALEQNYPNPFNPTTTIPYSVAAGTRTTITIYDILGREVARPVDEWKDPGEYKAQFDASGLATGMYICRFSAADVNQTRKLMLVR